MVASIPASAVVDINPNVISAGGSGLDLVGLMLTNSTRPPIGSVLRFSSNADVATYFGALSVEASLSAIYFAGYTGASITPAALLFAQYPATAVPAYLRGGNVSNLTLSQLQAIPPGTITLAIDGRTVTSGSINLSSATSFSNAAATIQTALGDKDASFTGVIAVTTGILTASAVTGTIAIGQTVTGGTTPAGTVITSQITGTPGGSGTYQTNITTAVASTAMTSGNTLVSYDSVSGAFIITAGTPGTTGTIGYPSSATATSLGLTAATGAVTSQGAPAGVPATAMTAITDTTQDFASFMVAFETSTSDKVAFAAWADAQNNRFLFAMHTANLAATVVPDTTTGAALINALGYSGTAPIYDPINPQGVAAFLMGAVASIDFTREDARVTAAFRAGSGLIAGVVQQTLANNLRTNGYNFYGAYATANDRFVFFYPGSILGKFSWIDSYINQIWLNNALQLQLMTLVTSVGSIPYNADGYALIEAAMSDPVEAAVNFGAIRAGVTLTALQALQVNTAAGRNVSDTIQQRGWYIQVAPASPQVRAARASPPINLWYTDGGSVQQITVSSVLVQ